VALFLIDVRGCIMIFSFTGPMLPTNVSSYTLSGTGARHHDESCPTTE